MAELITEDIVCKRCNGRDIRFEQSGPHIKAVCIPCDKYIKFVSSGKEICLYFGKYKDTPVSQITDKPYLEYVLANLQFNAKTHEAIVQQITVLNKQKTA